VGIRLPRRSRFLAFAFCLGPLSCVRFGFLPAGSDQGGDSTAPREGGSDLVVESAIRDLLGADLPREARVSEAGATDLPEPREAAANDSRSPDAAPHDSRVPDAAPHDVRRPDSTPKDSGAVDDAGTTCNWTSGPPAFGAPVSLGAPNTTTYSEVDPVLSHDGLTLYFVSYRSTSNDIYYATRSSKTASFGSGTLLASASTSSNETHYFLGPDGLEAFVASDRSGTIGGSDIFRATRAISSSSWGAFSDLAVVNGTTGDYDPHLEGDGLTLWFSPTNRSGGSGKQDLFYAVRTSTTSAFGAPVPATVLNSNQNDWNESLTDDGLVIVFQSDRGGSDHLYYSTRASRSSAFAAPAVLTALDPYISTLIDPFLSPDGCSLYFSAALSDAGSYDLYVVTAP
jgi:hypothetical protein